MIHTPLQPLARTKSFWVILFLLSVLSVPGHAQGWVHSWIAPPSTLSPNAEAIADPENHFTNQTIRLVAHSSAGGDQVRIHISNAYGEGPLSIAGVSVALQDQGNSIAETSLKPVTFSGKQAARVPQGALLVSDPVDLLVPAFANLVISAYFAATTPFISLHQNANQTGWVAPGDQTMAKKLSQGKERTSWDFITAVEVKTSEPTSVIATVGDSITDGYLSTVDTNNRWPNHLARRLQSDVSTAKFAVVNAGISGNRVLSQASPRFGQNLLARLERDVFSIPALSHIVLLEGINDIGMGTRNPAEAVTAEQIVDGYRQVITRAHANGVIIIGATLLPFEGAGYYAESGEIMRRQVNQWIRTSGEFDGVIDFELATRDPDQPTQLRRDFTTDNLHPNDAGYKAMADAVDLSLFLPPTAQ